MEIETISCIYCNDEKFEKGKGSREHVILSSMGGRKISFNICCENCNNRLGKCIDEGLSEKLSIISTLLKIKTGRNKLPPVQKNAVNLNGDFYNLLPSGEIVLGNVKKETIQEGNKIKFRVVGNTKEQGLEILKGQLKSYGKSIEHLEDAVVTESIKYGAKINKTFSFCENDLRSVAKMSLTMLATKISPERLRSGEFGDVIDYINGSDLKVDDIVFSDTNTHFPLEYKVSDVNHRIFIYASQNDSLAVSLVELYGGFRFSVLLSSQWSGPSLSYCYAIDPITQEKIDCAINASVDLKSLIANRGCEDSEAIKLLTPLFDKVMKLDREQEIYKIITSTMEKYNIDVLDENCDGFVLNEIAEALVDMFFKKDKCEVRKL